MLLWYSWKRWLCSSTFLFLNNMEALRTRGYLAMSLIRISTPEILLRINKFVFLFVTCVNIRTLFHLSSLAVSILTMLSYYKNELNIYSLVFLAHTTPQGNQLILSSFLLIKCTHLSSRTIQHCAWSLLNRYEVNIWSSQTWLVWIRPLLFDSSCKSI